MIRLLIFISLMPVPAFAEVLPVRGGEHADFTRLVVPLFHETNWLLDHKGQTATLFIEGASFDTSQAFVRIGRERVSSADAGDGQLTITLGCDCSISTLVVDGYLALDVKERTSTSILPVITTEADELIFASNYIPSAETMEARLAGRIARAAGDGLLLPSRNSLSDALGRGTQYPGISISSELDRFAVAPEKPSCPTEEWIDPSSWGMTGIFTNDLNVARSGFTGELGEISEVGAIHLAKAYLFYGLFEEGRAVLQFAVPDDPEVEILSNLINSSLQVDPHCSDAAALWTYLSGGEFLAESIHRGFLELPDPLQKAIIADLLSKLVEDGKHELGWSLVEYLPEDDVEYFYHRSRLEAASGDWDKATDGFLNAFGMQPIDPRIAAGLIEAADKGELSVPPETIGLVDSLMYSDQHLAASILRLFVVVAARSGEFEAAMRWAQQLDSDELFYEVLSIAAQRATDVEVVRLAYGPVSQMVVQSNPEFMARLVALGFHREVSSGSPPIAPSMAPQVETLPSLSGSQIVLDRSSATRRGIEVLLAGNGL